MERVQSIAGFIVATMAIYGSWFLTHHKDERPTKTTLVIGGIVLVVAVCFLIWTIICFLK